MDQLKIGRFIAEMRKEQGMTQARMADMLDISDRTVSKWERGRGLPEVSLMLPLCECLGITVNDLLTGERVTQMDYRKRAEENMLNLIGENQENRKRMTMSVICGVITVIAVCALVVIASFIVMPALARIGLLLLSAAVGVTGIGAAAALEIRAGYYQCPSCGEIFVPTMGEYVKGYHTFTRRRLKCPKCGKVGMCRHRIVR